VINLKGTAEILQLVTSAAGAIDVLGATVDWDEATETGQDPDGFSAGITTATTTALIAGAAGLRRNVAFLSIKNVHATVSNTVTLQRIDATRTVKIVPTPLTLLPGEGIILNDAGVPFVFDVGGGVKASSSVGVVDPKTNDFRLTGVSQTPVMTADSTTLSTVFLAPYKGNRLALWDGAQWQLIFPPSEVSLAVTGRTTDLPFDVFAFLNNGAVTLEFLNWASATARATGLAKVDGVWTKTGDATRRYLGSIRPRSATSFHWVTSGLDAPCKLDLWNADNKIDVAFQLRTGTNTWAYTLATWRQAQGSVNYQVDIMVGLQESYFTADLLVSSRNSTISIPRQVGIGFDSTTAFTGVTSATANTVASIECDQNARISNQPGIGRHFYAWLEISTATGTCTWVGDDGALRLQSGLSGIWSC
jgi:hypothetical protein